MPEEQPHENENGGNDHKDLEQPKPDQERRDTLNQAEHSGTPKQEATENTHANTTELAEVMYGTQSFGV